MSNGPIRTLTTIVKLVDRSKQGIRNLKKAEATTKRIFKRVLDIKRTAANLNAQIERKLKVKLISMARQASKVNEGIARKREAKLQGILKQGRAKLLGFAKAAGQRQTREAKRREAKLQGILKRGRSKILQFAKAAGQRQTREAKRREAKLQGILKRGRAKLLRFAKAADRRLLREQKAADRRQIREDKRRDRARLRQARKGRRALDRIRGRFFIGAGAGAAALTAGGVFIYDRIVRATAEAADNAAVLSQQIGMTSQAVQEIEFAGLLANTKFPEIKTALRRMADNAQDATQGAGMATKAFKVLGITVADLKGPLRDNDRLLQSIVKRLETLPKSVRPGGIMAQIFGRAGAKGGPLFLAGLKSLTEARKFAVDSGFVIGEELTNVSMRLFDMKFKVLAVIRGIRNDLAKGLIPALTDVVEAMVEWWMANREVITQKFQVWMGVMREAVDAVLFVFKRLDNLVKTFTDWGTIFSVAAGAVTLLALALAALAGTAAVGALAAMIAEAGGIAVILTSIGASLGATFSTLIAPLLPWIAAIVALGLAFEDILTFIQGGESVLGHFLEWLLGSKEAADALQGLLAALAEGIKQDLLLAFESLFVGVKMGFEGLVKVLVGLFDILIGTPLKFYAKLGFGDPLSKGLLDDVTATLTARAARSADLRAGLPGSKTTNNNTSLAVHGVQNPEGVGERLLAALWGAREGRER